MVIRRIGVWSAARLYGAIMAAGGLLVGLMFAAISVVGVTAGLDEGAGVFAGLFGVGAIIIAPIFYGVFGLIGGAIGALLYNLFAGVVGGLEVETE
jgi:hypothetical protein